jgi:hypothetical protein
LMAHDAAEALRQRQEGEALLACVPNPSTIRSSADGPPPPGKLGEELVVCGGQLKRVSAERWGKRREEDFLADLTVAANLRRACRAVGISYEAVRKRRRRDARFDQACKAAIAACRARAPEFLASAMAATFDPEAVLDAETGALPKVSVAEAIKIAQLKFPGERTEVEAPERSRAEIIASIEHKLERKLITIRAEQTARAWTWDELHQVMVPPGWMRDPDHVPVEGEAMEDELSPDADARLPAYLSGG